MCCEQQEITPPVAWAAVRSKVMVLVSLTGFILLLQLCGSWCFILVLWSAYACAQLVA